MNKEKKILSKEVLQSIETLASLGGFVEDLICESIAERYNPRTIEVVGRYMEVGKGFMSMADAVEEAVNKADCYEFFEYDEEGIPTKVKNEGFCNWYVDRSAYMIHEKLSKSEPHFWRSWKLNRMMIRTLSKLDPVEERVMFLSSSLDSEGKRRSAEEIAALPEFNCDASYINAVLGKINEMFRFCRNWKEEFEKFYETNMEKEDDRHE